MTHPELSSLTEQLVTPPPLTLWNSSLFSRIAWLPSIFCWLKQKGQHNKNIHMKNDKMIGSGLSDYSSLDCFCLYIYTTICIYFGRHYVWWPYDSNLGSSPTFMKKNKAIKQPIFFLSKLFSFNFCFFFFLLCLFDLDRSKFVQRVLDRLRLLYFPI